MKEIPLSSGLVALVDDEDYEFISTYKWYPSKGQKTYYANTNIYVNKKRTAIKMHTLLMGKGNRVDHKDQNGLNNQRSNLRLSTRRQNSANSSKTSRGKSSKYKGVSYKKKIKRWVARIDHDYLGCFKTEVEAAKAYNEAAIKRFGEFACTNNI